MVQSLKVIENISRLYMSLSETTRASLWFTIGNLIIKGISFITVPLFAYFMTPAEYGKLSVLMALQIIIKILCTWEVALGFFQKELFGNSVSPRFLMSSAIGFSNLMTIVFFGCGAVFFCELSYYADFSKLNFFLLFIVLFLEPAFDCWLVYKRSFNKYREIVFATIVFGFATSVVPLLAIILVDKTAEVKYGASLMTTILFYAYFYCREMKFGVIFDNVLETMRGWKYILCFQMPLIIHSLSFHVLAQSDRIMIQRYVGNDQTAFYSIAYSLGSIATIFLASAESALIPWRLRKLKTQDYVSMRAVSNSIVTLFSGFIVAFILVVPEVLVCLFKKEYHEVLLNLPPIALSVYFMLLNAMFVWVENFFNKTFYVAIASVSCAVLNLVLNFILLPIFGYLVCGYTTLVSYIMFAVMHYFFMKKVCNNNDFNQEVYDIRYILINSMVVITVSLAISISYQNAILRYALFLMLIASGYVNRDKILDLLRSVRQL